MNTNPPALSDDIPEILRAELERTPPVTPDMLAGIAAANRELEADPAWNADLLKASFVNEMLTALEARDETKAQLADRLGKTRQYIQKLFNEDKRVNFTIDTLCEVAHALGRRVHLHICEDGEQPMILTARKQVSADWPEVAPRRPASAWDEADSFRPSPSTVTAKESNVPPIAA